jgi:hypothetical protein
MTYVDQFEEMPLVGNVCVAFFGALALMFAGLVAITMLLVILKVAIVGVC